MSKLSNSEFDSLLNALLVDALYPDYVHIPGLGVRMSYESFIVFRSDLYSSYLEHGETGVILFFEKLKKRPDISIAVENTKKIIYSHIDKVGLKDENEKQRYVSNVVSSIKK